MTKSEAVAAIKEYIEGATLNCEEIIEGSIKEGFCRIPLIGIVKMEEEKSIPYGTYIIYEYHQVDLSHKDLPVKDLYGVLMGTGPRPIEAELRERLSWG